MDSTFKKYAGILLPAFVLIAGGVQALEKEPTAVGAITFLILLAGAVGTFGVKLVDTKWQGILKTGIPIVTALLAALIPLVVNHEISWVNAPLILVALANVLATELGVQIRTNSLFDAGTAAPGHASTITSVPATSTGGGVTTGVATVVNEQPLNR